MFERGRSKAIELLARYKDRATCTFYKGFRMLTLRWSDGDTFVPLDISLLSSSKSAINNMNDNIDKRSQSQRRQPELVRIVQELRGPNKPEEEYIRKEQLHEALITLDVP